MPAPLRGLIALVVGGLVVAGAAYGLAQIEFMMWRKQTGIFFIAIAAALVLMTAWELAWPTRERRGWLAFSTTRGDRFFLGLLGVAFIHLPFVLFQDSWPLWPAWVLAGSWLVGLIWKG